MFSGRFHWDFRPNRITRALEARRASEAPILDLTESNPTHAGLHYPAELLHAFEDPRITVYEPSPAGMRPARETVARYYEERGIAVDPSRILLTASTSEAYSYLFKLTCNPGDCVLVPRPSYPLFEFLAGLESVEVRQYPLVYDGGWFMDFAALRECVSERTRALVVVNPNNPTGSFLKLGERDALVRFCAEREIALVSDEVFADYALSEDGTRVRSVADVEGCLAFAMSGLSKIAALPQMKLGWIVTSGPEQLRREAFERLEWIADTFLSVGTPVQCAAERLLRIGESAASQIRQRTAANLETARSVLAGSAAGLLHVEGGWYATIRVPRIRSEEDWALELLERDGVLVQPGFFYDFESEAFLIASLLTPRAEFEEGIRRVAEAVRV
jgi:alanine-synthesizing transaminase